MNKKINKFLFAICSLFLAFGIANAETDYKTVCKDKTGDELIKCCSTIEGDKEKVACRESAFKKCGNEKGLSSKTKCCSNFNDFEALMDCNSYVKGLCTSSDSVEVNKEAMKVKIVYEPIDVVNPNKPDETYFMMDIKVYNLPKKMLLKVSNSDGNTYMVGADSANKDGVIILRSADTSEVKKYDFTIVSDGLCYGRELRKLSLTLPKYNAYSEREICDDIPTYYLCQKYINFDVDANKFQKNVENYKAKGTKTSTNTTSKTTTKTVNKTIGKISNHKYLIVAIIIVLGVLASYYVLKTSNRKDDKK